MITAMTTFALGYRATVHTQICAHDLLSFFPNSPQESFFSTEQCPNTIPKRVLITFTAAKVPGITLTGGHFVDDEFVGETCHFHSRMVNCSVLLIFQQHCSLRYNFQWAFMDMLQGNAMWDRIADGGAEKFENALIQEN